MLSQQKALIAVLVGQRSHTPLEKRRKNCAHPSYLHLSSEHALRWQKCSWALNQQSVEYMTLCLLTVPTMNAVTMQICTLDISSHVHSIRCLPLVIHRRGDFSYIVACDVLGPILRGMLTPLLMHWGPFSVYCRYACTFRTGVGSSASHWVWCNRPPPC